MRDTVLIKDRVLGNHRNMVLQRVEVSLGGEHLVAKDCVGHRLHHCLVQIIVSVPKGLIVAEIVGFLHHDVRVVSPRLVQIGGLLVRARLNVSHHCAVPLVVLLDRGRKTVW